VARIVIERLSKTFVGPKGEHIRALNEVNLTIEDKELLVLVGPSGCGKTTALRLIAGLERASSGAISMNGDRMDHVSPKERDVAMVFQNPSLYPHMTVAENIAFGLKLRKCPWPEIDRRVSEAAELLGLVGCLGRRPNELSGGQYQRVVVGRAIVRRPKVFLFDEPLSNLDPQLRAQMRHEISRLHTVLGATILYVTHDQIEALTLGHRVAVMRQGEIQQVSRPIDLYQRPVNLFVAQFIGAPTMNLLPGVLNLDNGAVFFQQHASQKAKEANGIRFRLEGGLAAALSSYLGKNVILGIRPEHVSEVRSAEAAAGDATIPAVLDFVECAGPDTFLYLSCGGQRFVARADAPPPVPMQGNVLLRFDISRACFFDSDTSRAIVCGR